MANHIVHLQVIAVFGECMRNHALDVPAVAFIRDGCGFFTPTAPDNLACAACGCNRNFHRRLHLDIPVEEPPQQQQPQPQPQPQPGNAAPAQLLPAPEVPRQRRPRITPEQSDQIREVVEANHWKMFRDYSSDEVKRICDDIGIHRMTLKSWISTHRRRRFNNLDQA